ncbi:MAG: Hsp33 family molecular chaperone HslO [Pseudomonadota bacterium]
MTLDQLVPFVFESLPVRGALIQLTRAWRRMQRDHDYDPLVRETLGHAAAATGLIAHSLKFTGSVTLQMQGSGPLSMLVMQATSQLELRGMATAPNPVGVERYPELFREAHCAITVDNGDQPYQGIVEIGGERLADSLEAYFDRSVQVPSHLVLLSNEAMAGGLLLQQMPGQLPLDHDDWRRLGFVSATLSAQELSDNSGIDMLRKLFAEDDVRVFDPRSVGFRCRCSRRRAGEVLRMLGEAEVQGVVKEQGRIEVTCEYCGERQRFDAIDVSRLFVDNVVSGPKSVQ